MKSYEAARSLYSFLSGASWLIIAFGGIGALVGIGVIMESSTRFGGSPSAMAVIGSLLPGLALALAGFICLAMCQMGRASVDTAEFTQQLLKVARDQLQVSRRALLGGKEAPTSFDDLSGADVELDTTKASSFANRSNPQGNGQDAVGNLLPGNSAPAEKLEREAIDHKGLQIEATEQGYAVNGIYFVSQAKAEEYVDSVKASEDRLAQLMAKK